MTVVWALGAMPASDGTQRRVNFGLGNCQFGGAAAGMSRPGREVTGAPTSQPVSMLSTSKR